MITGFFVVVRITHQVLPVSIIQFPSVKYPPHTHPLILCLGGAEPLAKGHRGGTHSSPSILRFCQHYHQIVPGTDTCHTCHQPAQGPLHSSAEGRISHFCLAWRGKGERSWELAEAGPDQTYILHERKHARTLRQHAHSFSHIHINTKREGRHQNSA